MKSLVLCLIVFLALAGTAQAVEPFPFETEAGMAAYVNVGSIDIPNSTDAYIQIYNLSTTHACGQVSTGYPVYVDTNGWIVAYLPNGTLTATMIDSNPSNPTNSLETSIEQMCNAIGANYTAIEGSINYYHFQYPQASNMLIFKQYEGYMTVFIPSSQTVYETTSNLFSSLRNAYLSVDNTQVGNVYSVYPGRTIFSYQLTKDVPHTLHCWGDYGNHAGTVILYS